MSITFDENKSNDTLEAEEKSVLINLENKKVNDVRETDKEAIFDLENPPVSETSGPKEELPNGMQISQEVLGEKHKKNEACSAASSLSLNKDEEKRDNKDTSEKETTITAELAATANEQDVNVTDDGIIVQTQENVTTPQIEEKLMELVCKNMKMQDGKK